MNALTLLFLATTAANWQHPAGLITQETITEIQDKIQTQPWAQTMVQSRRTRLDAWVQLSHEDLANIFPKKRGNVYHNFSCPADRHRLTFDPFEPHTYTCPICNETYPPNTDPGIYKPGDRYHGTQYDGWICMFYQLAGSTAMDFGLLARLDDNDAYRKRGIDILMLFADTIEGIETQFFDNRQYSRILTYHREGDNKVLNDLSVAYELLREHMAETQQDRFERQVLERLLDDVMLEPIYTQNHNNLYQWHRTILQTALSLEREDLIQWSFGTGDMSPQKQPDHSSISKLVATHFLPDGAYWEMCSGYHLYPVYAFCQLAVLSRNLCAMDPQAFPIETYDLSSKESQGGAVIHRALEWFLSMSMPDRTMTVVGDSTIPRSGMENYHMTAEIGYRYFDVKAVGDYEKLRNGQRSWSALLYGAPQIKKHDLPFTSSYLSSGWISLRSEHEDNQLWVGLNAMIPGGGHQHADRLTLLTYSHGELLALEKGTPYNESVTRVLGTQSQSHNTVTVDGQSMKQGEALKDDEIPEVVCFHDGDWLKYAEIRGDALYPQCKVYRRAVVIVEDIIIDCFRVEGGKTHDWIIHHAGPRPTLTLPLSNDDGEFSPVEWLYNGTQDSRAGEADNRWQAIWKVNEVTSRLTMMGAQGTQIYSLETYPIGNAVITPKDPPCQTLCVRRKNDAPFLAVWDAFKTSPNLVSAKAGHSPQKAPSVQIKTRQHTYHILFGPGEATFEDEISLKTDESFCVVRDKETISCRLGQETQVNTQDSKRLIRNTSAEDHAIISQTKDGPTTITPLIQHQTIAGKNHPNPIPTITLNKN